MWPTLCLDNEYFASPKVKDAGQKYIEQKTTTSASAKIHEKGMDLSYVTVCPGCSGKWPSAVRQTHVLSQAGRFIWYTNWYL
jgi:hypothetical protein